MEQMRYTMGLPNSIRFLDSGEEMWEYSDRRVGYGAYFAVFESDGRVREVKAVRTEEDIARIVPGTTTAPEVSLLLGEPSGVRFVANEPVWFYKLPGKRTLQVEYGAGRVVKQVTGAP